MRLTDATLEVIRSGMGEPLVLVQTALLAEEFRPLCREPALREAFHLVRYHRRGYAGSSRTLGPGSVERDATDFLELLDALDLPVVHLFGGSYSAAVAMTVAAGAPERVRSVVLVEPPPVHVPSADEFVAANRALLDDYAEHGAWHAVGRLMERVVGPHWLRDIERHVPGGADQVAADCETFLATDLPALLAWRFDARRAARVEAPVLYVGGTDSGPWFEEVRNQVLAWLPSAEELRVDGADHDLALTHSPDIAQAVAGFLGRHPIRG